MGTVNHQTPVHDHSNKQFGGKLPASSIHDLAAAVAALVFPHTHTANQITDFVAAVVALLTDANIPNNITLDNITQITNRAISDTTGTLAVNRGGTGQTTQQAAIDALTAVSGATPGHVLTKDGSGNATFQPAAAGYTDEQAQDAVGAMVDSSLNYVDGTPLLQRAALTGDVTASAGSNATTIANDAVTFAKMQNIATDRLIGRDTAGTGDPEAISVGGGISFDGTGTLQTSAFTGDVTKNAGDTVQTIANNAVSNAKLADMAEARVKGRSSGSGTGDPEDLTAAQLRTILGLEATRRWALWFDALGVYLPDSAAAYHATLGTTLRPVLVFDGTNDSECIIEGLVPNNYGSGPPKLKIHYLANSISATATVQFDVYTEFRTPGATSEPLNANNFDGTADSQTGGFNSSGAAYDPRSMTVTLTPATTPAAGDLFRIKVKRETGVANNLADLCFVTGFELFEEY